MHRSGGDGIDADQRERLTYRFATAADLERFYGGAPRMTTRAVVVLLNDEPVVVIGLGYGKDCATLYSDAKPEAHALRHRFEILRAIKLAMTLVKECKREVVAIRQEGTDILLRLGFEHLEGEIYTWPR